MKSIFAFLIALSIHSSFASSNVSGYNCRGEESITASEIESYFQELESPILPESSYGDLTFYNEKEILVDSFKTLFISNKILDSVLSIFGRRTENVLSFYRSNYPGDTNCTDVLCAVKSVWGDDLGPKILYAKVKYNFSTSEYTKKGLVRFNTHQLDSIIQGLSDIPYEVLQRVEGYGLSKPKIVLGRVRDSWASAVGVGSKVTFNMEIHNPSNDQAGTISWNTETMRGVLVHEIGHLIHGTGGLLSKFKKEVDLDCKISAYAETNNKEDFAETFRAFVFNSSELQRQCPDKYQFMRNRVFYGISELKDGGCL